MAIHKLCNPNLDDILTPYLPYVRPLCSGVPSNEPTPSPVCVPQVMNSPYDHVNTWHLSVTWIPDLSFNLTPCIYKKEVIFFIDGIVSFVVNIFLQIIYVYSYRFLLSLLDNVMAVCFSLLPNKSDRDIDMLWVRLLLLQLPCLYLIHPHPTERGPWAHTQKSTHPLTMNTPILATPLHALCYL